MVAMFLLKFTYKVTTEQLFYIVGNNILLDNIVIY